MDYKEILEDLLKRKYETSWFEFKENWFEPDKLGAYISALSNVAKVKGSDYGYFFWGVNDKTHEVVGTNFDYDQEIKNEPLEHYLNRKLKPALQIKFDSFQYNGKKVVILLIPQAKSIPTSFDGIRYTRIGSSLESLIRYPEKEAEIWYALNHKEDDLQSIESEYRDLTFNSLINYYSTRGITLNLATYKKNLGLLNDEGKYNLLAQLLSDDSHISIRVAIFAGSKKSDPLFSVKEFGFMNLLLSLEKILDYGDTFNIPQADERNRLLERKETFLFDEASYREAVINAFVHNNWKRQNAPMFTFYADRIEITSNGGLSPKLTIDDFYKGTSEPVNKKLSDIFLQLHISEKTGRGVPTILSHYGKQAFDFEENWIRVTMPFNRINVVNYQPSFKTSEGDKEKAAKKLNKTQLKILKILRKDTNNTISSLMRKLNLSHTAIQNNLNKLKKSGTITRVGANNGGYWKVND